MLLKDGEEDKEGKRTCTCKRPLMIIAFVIFITFVYASTWITNSESTFDEGTYTNTSFNSSGFVQLNVGNFTGNYTSKIFNAGTNATWNNISWTRGGYYQEELLGDSVTETGLGGVNMTGNVLLMHFNNDSSVGENRSVVFDYSGSLRNGSVTGGNFTSSGKFSGGMEFYAGGSDGIDVNVGGNNNINNRSNFTVSVWFKKAEANIGSSNYLFDRRGTNNVFHLYVSSGDTVTFLVFNESGYQQSQIISGGNSVRDTNWHHTVVGYNGTLFIYLDGTFKASGFVIGEINNGTGELTIGKSIYNSAEFNGTIDEVAIWNRSLSESEIVNLYKRGALRLNLSVRSCDDSVCSGESWSDVGNNTSPQSLSVSGNQYFQYNFEFNSNSTTYSPLLYNVTRDYNATYPVAILNSPLNNTSSSNTTIIFNCSTFDDVDLANITLYGNWSGGWHANETTNITGTSNSTTFNETLSDGRYIWNCLATDDENNINWYESNYSLAIDSTAPVGVLSCSPTTLNTGETITCTCTVTDAISGVNTAQTSYTANPSTSNTGTYTTTCSFEDILANSGSTSLSYTVSSSSGGSAAVSSPASTTHSWSVIVPETSIIMEDFDEEIGVKQIEIEVSSEASDVRVSVTQHQENPAGPTSSGSVYKYLEIATENLEDKLEKGIVVIQVEKNWTLENNIERDNVVMFEFNESLSKWMELVTTFTEEDDNNYYYEIELTSFSYFMIGEKVKVGEEAEDVERFNFVEMVEKVWNFVKVYWIWFAIGGGVIVLVVGGVILFNRREGKGNREEKERGIGKYGRK